MANEPVPAIIQELQRRVEALEKLTDELLNSGSVHAMGTCTKCGLRAVREKGQWVEIHLTTCPNAKRRDVELDILRGNRP